MIELRHDSLAISFPEVDREARMTIDFQRTLRIPDDGREYALPPGLGRFPVVHVDDHAARVPERWRTHGGVMLPMYQAEAMWLNFNSPSGYPFAVRVATGKIDAVTGEDYVDGLRRRPQNYLSIPEQPWLDGYVVEEGVIRQFVAMPLGQGYTVEEQITGEAQHGGIQLAVYPLKREVWQRIRSTRHTLFEADAVYSMMPSASIAPIVQEVGLAPGGRMRQKIYPDRFDLRDWDTTHRARCFVHIANSHQWREITGMEPPTTPPTAADYTRAGLPWFELYDERVPAVGGFERLRGTKSVRDLGQTKGENPLPENESIEPGNIVPLRRRNRYEVREGTF